MTRLLRCFAWVVAASLPLVAAPVPKAKQTDLDLVAGVWHQKDGGESGYWHFAADGSAGFGDKKKPQEAKFRIDPTETPKHLDWSHNGGKTWFLGIYELDGDSLKIALGRGGTGERPDEFEGKNRSFTYLTLKRVKD